MISWRELLGDSRPVGYELCSKVVFQRYSRDIAWPPGKRSRRPRRVSGTLLREAYVLSLCDRPGQPDQVVAGTASLTQGITILWTTLKLKH